MGTHWRYRTRKLVQRHPWRVASAVAALAGLVTALVVITGLYNRAETARRDAEKRFDDVRALAKYMLFELDARLEATPGNTAARREMVGRSQQYLDALASHAESARDRPALQREVAAGLARLAEVQGVPGRPHVGEPAAAKTNLLRAEAILQGQAAAGQRDWTWLRDDARVQYLLALMVGGRDNDLQGQVVRAARAERECLEALRLAEGRQDAAALAELHALLTSARLTRADAYRYLTEHAQAARLLAQEEQRLFELPQPVRDAMEFDFQAGRTALLLGDALYDLERKADALQAYERGSQRFQRALTHEPTNRRLLLGATTGYWYTSSVLSELGRLPEALRASDEALRISTQVLALDPHNVEAIRQRNAVRNDRAMVLAALRRFDEAIALIEDSMPEKQARADRLPDDFEAARDLAVPLRLLAQHYRDKGDTAGACRVLREAERRWAALDRRWGLPEFDRRTDVAQIREKLAACR